MFLLKRYSRERNNLNIQILSFNDYSFNDSVSNYLLDTVNTAVNKTTNISVSIKSTFPCIMPGNGKDKKVCFMVIYKFR